MAGIIFSEGSGLNDAVFGKYQAPIRDFLETRGEQMEQDSILKYLFRVGTTNNFADAYTGMTAMDGFDPVGEGGAYPKDSMQMGYDKLIQADTWKDSFVLTQEIVEDAKLMDLKRRPQAFINAYYRTRERFGAALYGAAIRGLTSVTFRGKVWDTKSADGVCLFSTSHTNKVTGTTQSNVFSNAFSLEALAKAETAMQNFTGDNDEELDIAPDTILIANDGALKKAVFAALGSEKEFETANNAWSYQYGRYNIVISPYLNKQITSGTSPWVLLDSKYISDYDGPIWNDRIPLTVISDKDPNTDDNIWRGRARWGAGFVDFRFAAVGGVTGGTEL